jgi:hypothetical protein
MLSRQPNPSLLSYRQECQGRFQSKGAVDVIYAPKHPRLTAAQPARGLDLTPDCHDGDDHTVAQTEGPYFKPNAPLIAYTGPTPSRGDRINGHSLFASARGNKLTSTALTTAADFFLVMLEPDYKEYIANPTSLRHAYHVANSLFHLADWVFHTDPAKVQAAFAVNDETEFANALEGRHPDFGRIRGIANAGKHLSLRSRRPVALAPVHAANLFVRVATSVLPARITSVLPARLATSILGSTISPAPLPQIIVLAGAAGGPDMEFSDIARSTYEMWLTLNRAHGWW